MFKLNIDRTFPSTVTVNFVDENGQDQTGSFTAIYKVMPRQKDLPENLLEQVLVKLEGLELTNAEGQVLTGKDQLEAAIADPSVSMALLTSYTEAITKKPRTANFTA